MPNYRVTESRWDDPTHEIATIEAINDEEAKKKFLVKYRMNQNYAWSNLVLIRIDQVEKTTIIDTNSRKPEEEF